MNAGLRGSEVDDIDSLVRYVCVYGGGVQTTIHPACSLTGAELPVVFQRPTRLCLCEPSQFSEQQEAFASIVNAQLVYMHFKGSQTELNAITAHRTS